VLGAAAIGAVALALAGGDDDSDEPPSAAELAQQRADEVARLLPEKVSNAEAGIVVRHPADWKDSKRGPIINIEAPDRCIVVSVSAPAGSGQAGRLGRDSVAALGATLGKTREQKLKRSEIDGLPTESSLVAARSESGAAVVVRQSVSKGKRHAYLTQTLYRAPPCAESSAAADLIVENLDLSK
jgi:hypothetical protein